MRQFILVKPLNISDKECPNRSVIRSVSQVLGLVDATTPVGFHFALPGNELHHIQCIALEQVKSPFHNLS